MERYKEYKDSGISWIGEIPSHWETCRMKKVFSLANEKTVNEEGTLLSLSQYTGITRKEDAAKTGMFEAESTIGYNIVHKGQFVMNIMLAWNGSYAVSDYEGIISPAYCVYNFNENVECNKKYMHYLLRLQSYAGAFKTLSKGIIDSRLRLYPMYFLSFYTILPSIAEQEKIVSYLEDKTSSIDAYVAEKEKELQLLNELKDAEIAQVVTQGLNPNVKKKNYSSLLTNSSPEHWSIMRNKSFLSLTGETVGDRANDFTLLSLSTKGVIVRDVESGKGKFPKDFDTYQAVKKDELVFCLFDIDETPRTVGLVETEGMVTGAYTALKVNKTIAIPEYVYYYYLCVDNIKALKPYYSGLRKTVRADKFLQIYIPLPPVEEQRAIVTYVEDKCAKVNTLIAELEAEIDYMKEYKQRLIADCVTGQVNVLNVKN